MEWATIVFLTAVGFLAWKLGAWYAVGISIFLILVALVYTLVKRHLDEQGKLVFSLIALVLAIGAAWLIRRQSKT